MTDKPKVKEAKIVSLPSKEAQALLAAALPGIAKSISKETPYSPFRVKAIIDHIGSVDLAIKSIPAALLLGIKPESLEQHERKAQAPETGAGPNVHKTGEQNK
jgi:hypothetical protein